MTGFLCSIPLLKSFISACAISSPLAVGYIEGEYVLVAPIETALIEQLEVRRGDRFEANQGLALLETNDAEISVRQAEAALAVSASQLADLLEGKRPEEIAVIEADLGSAKTQTAEAERIFGRQSDLVRKGILPQSNFDTASTNVAVAKAKVAQLEANLAVAKLPARPDQINAAQANVDQANAKLESARWRLKKRTLTSPKPGVVSDIIRNPGEVAGPQAPVLSVLPDGAIKLKLYVSESNFSKLKLGEELTVNCDACGEGMTATISYISTDPEFTPPVIYSLENRQKLVYLIEALPDDSASALKPGQLVDVQLLDSSK